MRISSSWTVPLAVVTVLIVAAVGSWRSYVDDRGRPVVIYAHPPRPPSLMALYEPIWEEFKRSHPRIDFRVLHITGKYEDKIKVIYVGKSAPDIIFMYPTALPAWAELASLTPLDEFIAKDPAVSRGDYFESMLRTFTYQGKLYGLPKDASVDLLYWNCDLFEARGVDPPEPMRHPSGHGGSAAFISAELVNALLEEREPAIDLYESLAMTVPGIVAHASTLKEGEQLAVPQFDRVPR